MTEANEVELLRLLIAEAKHNARTTFWRFCQYVAPEFYLNDRRHLRRLCDILELLYRGLPQDDGKIYKKLIINMPPQHGKTRTLTLFCQWILGQNVNERFIQCSYADSAAVEFSRFVRDGISETKNSPTDMVYSDVFPDTKIKYGDGSVHKWALAGQHFNFIGAGVGGAITGKGGTVLIVDDPIKGAEEALNEGHLDKVWLWYEGTFKSRVSAEDGEPLEIVNHTRWSKRDVCGRILEHNDGSWYVLKMPAYDPETETMLCESLFSRKMYDDRKASAFRDKNTKMIFMANYDQQAIDVEGLLYSNLKTYTEVPRDDHGNELGTRKAYTDTADEGDDYLCTVVYLKHGKYKYVLDVQFNPDANEVTEPETANLLIDNGVTKADVESNNGGRAFARNVKRIMEEDMGYHGCELRWFHQSKNKQQRINANSATVQEQILFPVGWMDKWPKFYAQVTEYQRVGKNKHDDGPDVLTGIIEKNARREFKSV